ncbi:MAG TPA: T9SS type A sorting domain-containing protein, partial [Paludibacteraceae bacterium]|nr:T9SS type A sorting domain-containing protein [Paludibacteraceae bacterium]
FPQQDGYDITLALYDLEGNLLKKQSDNKGFTGEWNATYTGWVTLKVWNNNSENISQKCWVRVKYYAPPTITDVYTDTPDTRVSIWTANGNTSTWNDCNNWEQGKVPANNATVIIPNHTPIVPIMSGNLTLKKLVIEQGKGNIGSPDLIVNGSLTVNELTILSGTAYICGNGTTEVSIQNGSVSNCATRIEEPSFSIEHISVIPNPVESICELRFISNSIGVAYFTLTDVTGKTILTKEIPINAIGINSTNLYLGGIHTGTYIAKINCNNRISSVMIVKK